MIDLSLAQKALHLAEEKHLSLGSVESLTGGLFAATICAIPGASKVFKGAVVSYANEVKEKLVNVQAKTITTYGVVSAEVAKEMALGGLQALNVDLAVSFTGNAGPSAEPGEAPVGRVNMALALRTKEKVCVRSYQVDLKGERNAIREQCVNVILQHVIEELS